MQRMVTKLDSSRPEPRLHLVDVTLETHAAGSVHGTRYSAKYPAKRSGCSKGGGLALIGSAHTTCSHPGRLFRLCLGAARGSQV